MHDSKIDEPLRSKLTFGRTSAFGDAANLVRSRCGEHLWTALVGIVALLVCLPSIRTIYWLGDEGVLLQGAARMLRGDRLYADFFEFLPPGGFVLTAAWFSMTGVSFLSARILVTAIVVGISCLTFLTCRRASGNALLSAFLTIGWLLMTQPHWKDLSHHWFTTFFSMIAFWAALVSLEQQRRWPGWPLIAGLAGGTAAMVTPTRGALAILAALVAFSNFRRRRAETVTYVLASGFASVGLIAYLIGQNALFAAFDGVIVFAATRYASIQGVPYGFGASIATYPLLAPYPVAAVLLLIVFACNWRNSIHDRTLRLCAAFAFAGYIGFLPRPDISHIGYAMPLVCPLLAFCATQFTKNWNLVCRKILVWVVIWLGFPVAATFVVKSITAMRAEIIPMERGGVAIFNHPGAKGMLSRIEATPETDTFFFYPFMPVMPFLTGREHVSKINIYIPSYTLPQQYYEACLAVASQADWVVIDRKFTNPLRLKIGYPQMRNPRPPETEYFENALVKGFEFMARDGTYELRRRREGISDAICDISAKQSGNSK